MTDASDPAPPPVDELSRRLAELEGELAEARRVGAAKDAFVAAVSHELRSPLHAILGNADLLRERTSEPESLELVGDLLRSARGLLGLTNDLLDMAALGTDAFALHRTDLVLHDLFDDLLASFRPVCRERRLPLVLTYDEALPLAVLADGQRLGQILTNLVANALRFTDEGRVEVRAACCRRTDARPGVGLRVEVLDTGVGVPVDERAHLFVPFHQSPHHAHRRGGTGLGLAICKKLVDQMDGRIGHAPRADRGSLFWFEVPLTPSRAPTQVVSGRMTPPPPGAPQRRVLVVEDNETNRLWARRALGSRNIAVSLAESGQQALEMLRSQAFDAIVMDWQMPDMDGLETTRAIRALGGAIGAIPIVGLSASALPDAISQCLDAGMNDCLLKPVSIRTLVGALDRLLVTAPRPLSAPRAGVASVPAPAPLHPLAVQIAGLPVEVCIELAELFARHVPERCDQIDQALLANDPASLTRHVHAVASSAGGIQRVDLCAMAQALEARLLGGASCAEVAPDVQHLSAEVRRLAPLLVEATRALAASAPSGPRLMPP